MIDRALLRDHLALERRSLTELATGLSAIAIVGATLYNLGFFAPIEWSLISLLTVQDLLIGAVVAAIPMAAAGWAALWIGKLIQAAPSHKYMTLLIGTPTLAGSALGFCYFFSGPGQSTLGHLASGYFGLGVIAALANVFLKARRMVPLWLVFSLLYIPTVLGMSDSAVASGAGRATSEIETDRGVILGRVVRVTSAYLLIARGNAIVTMPMTKVREVRRLYVQSPEADFLTGSVGSEP
jgi:hypothetical protein